MELTDLTPEMRDLMTRKLAADAAMAELNLTTARRKAEREERADNDGTFPPPSAVAPVLAPGPA